MTDATRQQIRHIATLHRYHAARHKRYRESPLAEAIEDLTRQAQVHKPRRTTLLQHARDWLDAFRWAWAVRADIKNGRRQ